MSQEVIFAEGFSFKRNENAPDFVVGKVSAKVDDAIKFLKTREKNGWVNMDIKLSKGGKYYMELDTWVSEKNEAQASVKNIEVKSPDVLQEEVVDDLPF